MNLLIKPASGLCNMRCSYCFYADEMAHREKASYGIMSYETVEQVLRKALSASERDGSLGLSFQGGEPTLAGLDFFRFVTGTVERYNEKRLPVSFAIQTNGYAIDEEWAKFFGEHGFLVGLSIDGPKELHDRNRVDASGKGTFARVLRTAELFRKYGVTYNTVTVLTNGNARSITSVYRFFKNHGMTWQQYIPCLDPFEGSSDQYLDAKRYGECLCRLFDLWYADLMSGSFVYNRTFENYVAILAGRLPEECGMRGRCGVQFVVEADGGVYPCDFYVLDEYRLGNFNTDSVERMLARADEIGFEARSLLVDGECRSCRYYPLCRGGCRRYREPFGEDAWSRNRFCESYQIFFAYAADRLCRLTRMALRNNPSEK